VELDALLKSSLCLNKPDLDRCLSHLDEISTLTIDPLMLKKHPQVVETIKKVNFKFLCSFIDTVYTRFYAILLNIQYVEHFKNVLSCTMCFSLYVLLF
jgi:hypothetical protein